MINHFRILQVKTTVTPEELKKAYQARCLETHPDKGGSPEAFQEVSTAYQVLRDPVTRRDWERDYLNAAGAQGHVVCLVCFAVNRVREIRPGQIARCAACLTPLEVDEVERRERYTEALKEQLGDLVLTIGAETGALAQDAVRAAARALRRKLGIATGD